MKAIALSLFNSIALFWLAVLLIRATPASFIAIRTPWTLASTESWRKTNLVGGSFFALLAIFVLVAILLPWLIYPPALTAIPVCVLAIIAYSFFVWRGDPSAGPAQYP